MTDRPSRSRSSGAPVTNRRPRRREAKTVAVALDLERGRLRGQVGEDDEPDDRRRRSAESTRGFAGRAAALVGAMGRWSMVITAPYRLMPIMNTGVTPW